MTASSPGRTGGTGGSAHGGGSASGKKWTYTGGSNDGRAACSPYQNPGYQGKTCIGHAQLCVNLYDNWVGTVSVTALNSLLAANKCPTLATGHPAAKTPPAPAVLAQRAVKTLVLPAPSGHRSPSETQLYRGYPFTYVGLWTFYWTDPATWHTRSITAHAGAVWATVTATPYALSYTPGDGSAAVSCPGPGRPWITSDGNDPPNDGACGYQYRTVTDLTDPDTSVQTILWRVTWTGSGHTTGHMATLSTSTTGQLIVMQIQIVNTH